VVLILFAVVAFRDYTSFVNLTCNHLQTLPVTPSQSSNTSFRYLFLCCSFSIQIARSCEAYLVDRRTHFEKNVFPWVGQLILYLFAFTSLFKPSFRATMAYTVNVGVIGFLGCWCVRLCSPIIKWNPKTCKR